MNALEILNKFIESGSPPDILSHEYNDNEDHVIRFEWYCGTILDLSYDGSIYDAVWKRFQDFWDIEGLFTAKTQRSQRTQREDKK